MKLIEIKLIKTVKPKKPVKPKRLITPVKPDDSKNNRTTDETDGI
tara:strand:+ start:12524 stop:12658 length:135 start_codon:yes stop_codon:yes gene_type:complete